MSIVIPAKVVVWITARYLDNEEQGAGPVVGFPRQITYRVESTDGTYFTVLDNILPVGRIVSDQGDEVRIEAAKLLDEATVYVLPGEMRLYVREGVVYNNCEDPPEP